MNRKHVMWIAAAVAGAVVVLWWIQQQHVAARVTPDWGDPNNPATGAAGQPTTPFPLGPDPLAAWTAVRPGTPHMLAGSRVHRHYPSTLVDDPESMVR